jgi:hypothetical protein
MTRLPDHDGLRWHPQVRIEKYSPDQVRWARERLAVESARQGTVLAARLGRPAAPALHGSWLRAAAGLPECGVVYDRGNGVVLGGTANLALVLTGAGGHPLAPGRAVFGVGSDDSAFDREHVHLSHALGEEPGRSWYRPMDAGYPRVRPGAPAVIEFQATFAETEACFAWHEWCAAAGEAAPVPHHSLRGAYGGGAHAMMNRKAHPAGYGMKEPGVAWCFRAEITLS